MSTLAPRLRHAITFEEQIEVRDSEGVVSVSWAPVYLDSETPLIDVPAEVLTGPGREFLQSGQMQSDVAARITCRWFPGGINSSWRILWDGRIFNIKGVPDTDSTGRREWRIKATAGINDGQ
ncbi:phage head closure protein [Lysobacter antibioticus]|uniref:phage head closure protein n=1 Tax=Lysobacter antibioticus TaxID=84531 RepID=UPI0007E8C908|nr:phage head closure protein [Lysobacter antibioticus]